MFGNATRHCCACCRACLGCTLVAALVTYAGYWSIFHGDAPLAPGDSLRRTLQPAILSGLASDDWSALEHGLGLSHGGLIIGDSSGTRWSTERGWMSLGHLHAIASQTKFITALTVYRLMARSGGRLLPSSLVAEVLGFWPQPPAAGGNVSLADLLSLTAGFRPGGFDKVDCPFPRSGASWEECVRQIAAVPIQAAPGETFAYGPHQLVVAGAVALEALGLPLTRGSWTKSVQEEVYRPAGIEGVPDFSGWNSDFASLPFLPDVGSWFVGSDRGQVPDLGGGMRMSGWQWAKVLHATQFGGLLSQPMLEELTRDHTAHVRKWSGLAGPRKSLTLGTWHYGQGCWLTCDVAARAVDNDGMKLGEALSKHCGGAPQPKVVHSLGFWGFYAWMDFTHGYYGVLVFSSAIELARTFWVCFWVIAISALLMCYLCGPCAGLYGRLFKARPESTDGDSDPDLEEVDSASDSGDSGGAHSSRPFVQE